MESRTCPHCGMVWWSADTRHSWVCEICGHEIPPEEPEDDNKKS